MLTRKGVTAWRHALAVLTPNPRPAAPVPAPAALSGVTATLLAPIAAELVHALAAVALAGT